MEVEAIRRLFEKALVRLEAAADPERAREAARFFPGEVRVLGVPSGFTNALGRELADALREQGWGAEEALWLAERLYAHQCMEAGAVANEMLGRRWRWLSEEHWERFDRWLDWFDNWATTDSFCLKVSGPLVARDGAPPWLRRWAEGASVWRRRAALVSLIPAARRGGERDLLLALCALLLADEEPYVQKAIGWSLKELCKADIDAVIAFLQAHGDAMPAATVRYACERMTDAQRAMARGGA